MTLRVLNLGAGVQSTTLYLMMIDGVIPRADVAIFADTGEEPSTVYAHLDYLKTLPGPPIHIVSHGKLGDNLIEGVSGNRQRFVTIPAYIKIDDQTGIGKRQCTNEYKIVPIEREIRRQLGVQHGCRIAPHMNVVQVFGLSYDEPKRVARVRDRFIARKQWSCEFPLFDEFMTRSDCISWLKSRIPNYVVPRSACVFCPYHSDEEWRNIKDNDTDGWNRAIEIDRAIRDKTSICTNGLRGEQFLHRQCVPLDQIEFKNPPKHKQPRLHFSEMDCEGMCGI